MSFARILHSTIANYIRKEEVNIIRRRKVLAALQKKGRLTFNKAGTEMDWKVRYKRAPLIQYSDAETVSYPRRNKRKTATLGYRAYMVTDSMTKFERLQNRGEEAIIKLYSNLTKELLEDIKENFNEELYVDGNASGNTKRIHGFNSCFGCSGNGNGTTSLAVTGVNNDTYAGLSTAIAGAGSWTGVWPNGSGDTQYDYWTPLVVDVVNTGWASGAGTFAADAIEAIRFGIINTQRNTDMLDMIVFSKDYYTTFLSLLDDKERIMVERNRSNSLLVSLGFGDVQNFDGVDITWEYGCPVTRGFGLSMDALELVSMQGQLFVSNTEDFDVTGMSHRFSVDFYGNLKMNPRSLVKFTDAPATT